MSPDRASRPTEPPSGSAIAIRNLSKRYGPVLALDRLTLDVAPGEIVGFLGPNGAGKSTTIRILLDLIRPDAGHATILGRDCQDDGIAARGAVGYLPGDVRLYGNWDGHDLVRHAGGFRSGGVDPDTVSELRERLALDLTRKVRTLSKGNRQKLGLLIALMHDPPVLILDEPTAGLDPLRQREVWSLLRERARRGAAVLFSSHVMSEVEKVCDRVAVLRAGRLLAVDSVAGLTAGRPVSLRLAFRGGPPDLGGLTGARNLRAVAGGLAFDFLGDPAELIHVLDGAEVVSLVARPPDLEDAVLDLYEEV